MPSPSRVFFILHEQYTKFTEEPAFVEVVKPFLHSGYVSDYQFFVFQKMIREFQKDPAGYAEKVLSGRTSEIGKALRGEPALVLTDRAETVSLLRARGIEIEGVVLEESGRRGKGIDGEKVVPPAEAERRGNPILIAGSFLHHQPVPEGLNALPQVPFLEDLLARKDRPLPESFYDYQDLCILREIARFSPDLVVLTLAGPGENVRSSLFPKIKKRFPRAGLYIQWWDFYSGNPEFVELEKDCLRYAGMVGIVDSYSRFTKIRDRQPPYEGYPNPERLHWLPTVFDPELYRKQECEKKYDVAVFGSAENERVKYIRLLADLYGPRFHHFGSLQDPSRFISKADYVRCLNETRISVNTQTYRERVQFKGKIREALSCGTFVLEEWNPETPQVVPEGNGYVFFYSCDDLKAKIDYYLRNEAEREAIALKGYDWYRQNFSSRKWAGYILENIRTSAGEGGPGGKGESAPLAPTAGEGKGRTLRQSGKRNGAGSSPFFSVVVPTRNRASLLADSALKSILRQTFSDFEIIVCDNASTDNTREAVSAVRDPRVRYIRSEEWIPKEDFFQFSLNHARGKFSMLFFDDDALLTPALEKAHLILREIDTEILCYSRACVYHFPNWHEDCRKNVLTIPPFTGKLLALDSHRHLEMVFERMDILPETPMVTNAFYRTSFLRRLAEKYGRLFPHGHMGDYNVACFALWNTKEFLYFDLPLAVFGHWKENTSEQLHDLRTTLPEYIEWIEWITRNYLAHMPVKSYTWLNCVAASLLDMKKRLELPYELDWPGYFIDLGREIRSLRAKGRRVDALQEDWLRAGSQLSDPSQLQISQGIAQGRKYFLADRLREIPLKNPGLEPPRTLVGKGFQLFPGQSYSFGNVLEAAEIFESLAFDFEKTFPVERYPAPAGGGAGEAPSLPGERPPGGEPPLSTGETDSPRETVEGKRRTPPLLPGEIGGRFENGDYATVALQGPRDDWRTYAALGLVGKTQEALEGLERFDLEAARFYSGVARWIGGDDRGAMEILERVPSLHGQNLLRLIRAPKIQVLAQLPYRRLGTQDLLTGMAQDKKFQVNNISFHPCDLPNEPYADIHKYYDRNHPPHFYICQMVEWHLLPPNLSELPCPLIGQTADYDLHIQAIYPWLQLFDEMLVCDGDEWADVRRLVSAPVSAFPKTFCIPRQLPPLPRGRRGIDFFLSGTVKSPYNPDKARLWNPLLRMPGLKARIYHGYFHPQFYWDHLAQSKVTCAYTRRPRNTPTRGLEALAMGCALAVQEDNVLTLYAGEREGVLTYTLQEGDLPRTVRRIVDHWGEFEKGAQRGAEVIRREFHMDKVASQYLRFAAFLAARPRGPRPNRRKGDLDQRRLVKWKGWLPGNEGLDVLVHLRKANLSRWEAQSVALDPGLVNLFAREVFLGLDPDRVHVALSPAQRLLVSKALNLCQACIARFPHALVLQFNYIRNALHYGLPEEVTGALMAARELTRRPDKPWELEVLDDVFTWDYANSFFNFRRYTDLVTRQLMTGEAVKSDLVNLILASLHYYLGHYTSRREHFQRAVELDPGFPFYRLSYSLSLLQGGAGEEIIRATEILEDLGKNSILDGEAYQTLAGPLLQGRVDKKKAAQIRVLLDHIQESTLVAEPVASMMPLQPGSFPESERDYRMIEERLSRVPAEADPAGLVQEIQDILRSSPKRDFSGIPSITFGGLSLHAQTPKDPIMVLKQQGIRFYQQGDFPQAEKSFQQALTLNSRDPDLMVTMGKLYYDQQKNNEALRYVKQALEINPCDAEAWAGVALLSLRLRDLKTLETARQKLRVLAPSHPVLTALEQGRTRRAQRDAPAGEGWNRPAGLPRPQG